MLHASVLHASAKAHPRMRAYFQTRDDNYT